MRPGAVGTTALTQGRGRIVGDGWWKLRAKVGDNPKSQKVPGDISENETVFCPNLQRFNGIYKKCNPEKNPVALI
jgi:hypothetical protein